MSVEFFTKSQSSPYEKFLANTGFMRPNIPPEVEHLIYRMTTFENCAYEPLKDKNITLLEKDIIDISPVRYEDEPNPEEMASLPVGSE